MYLSDPTDARFLKSCPPQRCFPSLTLQIECLPKHSWNGYFWIVLQIGTRSGRESEGTVLVYKMFLCRAYPHTTDDLEIREICFKHIEIFIIRHWVQSKLNIFTQNH